MLRDMFDFVVDQAVLHDELKLEDRNAAIKIFMPKISVRDLQRVTQSLRNLGSFVGQAFKANQTMVFNDATKKRVEQITNFLLDHVDLSTNPDVLVDLESGEEIDKTLQDQTNNQTNGRTVNV